MLAILAMLFAASATAGITLPLRWLAMRGGSLLRGSLFLYAVGAIPFAAAMLWQAPPVDVRVALLGGLCGAASAGAIISAVAAMRHGKAGPTTLVVFMSTAVPVVLGRMTGWDGPLPWYRFVAIGLGGLAVCLCTLHKDGTGPMRSRRRWLALALLGMLLNAGAGVCLKTLAGLGLGEHRVVFNVFFFPAGAATALALSPVAGARLLRRRGLKLDFAIGAMVGLLASGQLAAGVFAVARIHAAVFFPTYAILPLILASLGGRAFFAERLGHLERAGLGVACAALLLLNV